jgi:multicomponent Na+:H+ antiporter subunit B
MTSLILATATRIIFPLLLLLSLFLLLRGHDQPGGGFIAALVLVAAFALDALAYGVDTARGAMRVDPHVLVGAGLFVAIGSGAIALAAGLPLMTSRWWMIQVPGVGEIAVGTPLLFDLGVFLVVAGVVLMIVLALAEE